MKILQLAVLLSIPISLFTQTAPKKIKLPKILKEVSGIYIAAPDSIWGINDSNNPSILYLTNSKGTILQELPLPIKNVDWEDLTYDVAGNIYIGEFGNNRNNRKDLKIYKYHVASGRIDSIRFTYPDQTAFPPAVEDRNFDMEGFFWHNHQLHLFSKNIVEAGNYFTKHYTLSEKPGVQKAVFQDSIYLKDRVVTSAAISQDGQTVVLLTYNYKIHLNWFPKSKVSLFIINNFEGTRFLKGKITEQKIKYLTFVSQYESVDFWDKETVLIASEKTIFYTQKAKSVVLRETETTN